MQQKNSHLKKNGTNTKTKKNKKELFRNIEKMKKTSEREKNNKTFFFLNISGQQQRQENWVCFVCFFY